MFLMIDSNTNNLSCVSRIHTLLYQILCSSKKKSVPLWRGVFKIGLHVAHKVKQEWILQSMVMIISFISQWLDIFG